MDILTPNEWHLSISLGLSLFLPLYSDWNSALATWGLAWEAHIYGLGSVFSVFGLISLVGLLGLPLRCPAGILYFLLLHLFLLSFVGMQAFCLIYDPYSFQDRLPPLALLLLCSLPFPCLISAFSTAFVLLSLRSNMQISLPLAISPSFSALPKPCLLLSMSFSHFVLSLGCAGILQLFPSLPSVIVLIPQCVFVCLSIFLSCSYFVFFCLIRVDSIYRLDNGERGSLPEVMRHRSCPLAKMEDWERALRAGLGASLCLFCSGGLQLYGVLHALGLGGFDDLGFHPWPWLGFQVSCRLCEIGVCLGLALFGMHPIFCHSNSSIKRIINPQPRSWSRLSCGSPSRGMDLPPDGGVLSSHESWGKQEIVVTIKDEMKERSDALPLCSVVDSAGNGLECVQKKQISVLPLPSPPNPGKAKNEEKSNQTSLNRLDSTVDLRPPSPINLSRSIDQALFSESLLSHSFFNWPKLFQTSSSLSINRQGTAGLSSVEKSLYRTSSCGDMDQENNTLQPHNKQPMSPTNWKESASGSTQGLCTKPKETAKARSHSWANRGHHFAQNSLPRAIQHLSHYRRFRTLSFASQDSQGSGRLAGTKHLSESKQLEWDLAVQAEFVSVCKQIDALSVCSDTIEL